MIVQRTSPSTSLHPPNRCRRKPDVDPLETHWDGAPNENKFNATIIEAVKDRWGDHQPPLAPLLMKSLILQESDFEPNEVAGDYVGLTQISPEEARSEGLIVNAHKDERFVPAKNVHAGVGILMNKLDVMLHPESIGEPYPYVKKVLEAYDKYGQPTPGTVTWSLALGAYNGGEGTVMRAMANAFDADLNPVEWNNLIQPKDDPEKSPLYVAAVEVFGQKDALAKYQEISKYPLEILTRAPQDGSGT